MNLLVVPGLGSLLVRRRGAGMAQVAIAACGASMSMWWLAQLLRQWAEEGEFPFDGGEHFPVALAGLAVFAFAWLWSLATSLAAVRAARLASGPAVVAARVADFLVTGTDTAVGKTVVAAALVLALRKRGTAVGFKPMESGVEAGVIADSALLARASGADDPSARPLASLAEPLAPAVAAERAGRSVDPRLIESRVRALQARHQAVVVEGAGGAAVPLAWGYTVIDLAAACGLRAVVVARPGLGTLNHVWLTVEALRARGITVAAVVLNGAGPTPDLAEETNPAALARMLAGVTCLSLPRHESSDPWVVAQAVAPLLASLVKI
jgi:dethiobiotin synthetase